MLRVRLTWPLLLAAAASSCDGDSPTPPPEPVAATLQYVDGDAQAGEVATTLPQPLRVRVLDARGAGVAGATVQWQRDAGSLSVGATSTTDAAGYAEARWTLGTAAGEPIARAVLPGSSDTVRFRATATPGPLASFALRSRLAMVRSGGTTRLVAEASDRYGNVIPGMAAQWSGETPQVARVDADGAVTGVIRGTALVVASLGALRDTAYVKVDEVAWAAVSVGDYHTCARAADATAYCWGQNTSGELGDGTTIDRARPAPVAGRLLFAEITAEARYGCGLTIGREAYCWGDGLSGTFGNGSAGKSTVPVPAGSGLTLAELTAGGEHGCGRTETGAVYCWGGNGRAQLGTDLTAAAMLTPVRAAGGPYALVDAGRNHNCAIALSGPTLCWGNNDFGAVGTGNVESKVTPPQPVKGNHRFRDVSAGFGHTCALDDAGAAYCWGNNLSGQVGDGTTSATRPEPTPVATTLRFSAIYAGAVESCALSASGEAWCWGNNQLGQLGNGATAPAVPIPVRVSGTVRFAALAVGSHSCGVTRAGDLYCWGYNIKGALGDGTTVDRLAPTKVLEP